MKNSRWRHSLVILAPALWWICFSTTGWSADAGKPEIPSQKPTTTTPDQPSVEERLRRVNQRLRAAEREIEITIQKHKQQQREAAEAKAAPAPSAPGKLQLEIKEIKERINTIDDDLENMLGVQDKLVERVSRDRLQWSASYRATVNNFHLTDDTVERALAHLKMAADRFGQPIYDPTTGGPKVYPVYLELPPRNVDKWYGSSWVNRLRLTLTFDVTDNLRFYGRITVFKYFNELKTHSVALDQHTTRYPRDPTLRIERAYFDWFIADWLVLTVGRIASPEGPPAELKENTVRSATWGIQMVEAEMEAIMATIHLSSIIEGTYLRLFYLPFTIHTDFVISDDLMLIRDDGIDPMHAWGLLFELKIPKLGDNLWQLGFVHVPFRPRNILLYVPGLEDPLKPSEPTGQDLGNYFMLNGLMELKDIGGSGLDLFAAYVLTILQPTDARMVYQIPVENLPVLDPQDVQQSSYTGTLPYMFGLASWEEGVGTTNYGHMVYAGLRFTLPGIGDYAPRLGAEFNRGTKYHIGWSTPSDLLVNKLATKGWVWEVYYIQQLLPNYLFLRVGYLEQIREQEGLYIGPTRDVDQVVRNFYALIDASW